VLDYMRRYSRRQTLVPPEHVLVFDEAQRAWDRERFSAKHALAVPKSEHEQLIEIADRVPGWSVVVALLGVGQEILGGEEGGIVQWHEAVERSRSPGAWSIHAPQGVLTSFPTGRVPLVETSTLNLDAAVRFHRATRLHEFVSCLLQPGLHDGPAAALAARLAKDGYHLRITRDLQCARDYVEERYRNEPEARYGLIASSRDKALAQFGVKNDQSITRRLRIGEWFAEGSSRPVSCRHLRETATEFQVQGLELDGALLAWGTDFVRTEGSWSNAHARRHRPPVHDALGLRVNAYRVLLTRARDGVAVFVPPLSEANETYEYFVSCGFRVL
jgi:hypothetical protein